MASPYFALQALWVRREFDRKLAAMRLHEDSKIRSQIFQHVENFLIVGKSAATPLRMSATDCECNSLL